ncbi:hypothetical protein BDZ91DRAFT_370242 [Kalaharituber pfeilii]|nr:hypothetical protein BDZ91DRAFT_370242 [Kalaharituber pfeilii]
MCNLISFVCQETSEILKHFQTGLKVCLHPAGDGCPRRELLLRLMSLMGVPRSLTSSRGDARWISACRPSQLRPASAFVLDMQRHDVRGCWSIELWTSKEHGAPVCMAKVYRARYTTASPHNRGVPWPMFGSSSAGKNYSHVPLVLHGLIM